MGLFNDIEVNGKHAGIMRKLHELKLYNSFADIFTEAMLIGLYHGKKSEIDGVESDSYKDSAHVSFRTYFARRSDLERILVTYRQHEKLYQEDILPPEEVFLVDEESKNLSESTDELKAYGLYGVEVLGEKFGDILNTTNIDSALDEVIEQSLLKEHELRATVKEDDENLFYKSFDDDDINSILGI